MELWRRLLFLFRRRRIEREIADEMRHHAEQTGASQFGNLMRLQEETREAWGFCWLDRLSQDLRYTARTLRRAPGFAAVAILSLALGIGANTAIFSLINAIVLRSLPVRAPEQLFQLTRSNLQRSDMKSFPYPFFRELRAAKNLPVTDPICTSGMTPGLEINGNAERITGEMVSGNFFDSLGVRPYLGRLLAPGDEIPGSDRVAVISYGYWKRRFSADKRLVGSVIHLNTIPITVIGIAPPGFTGMSPDSSPDVRVPITLQQQMYRDPRSMLDSRGDWWLTVVARLRPGTTSQQAEAALTAFLKAYLNPASATTPYARRVFDSQHVQLQPAATGISSRAKNSAKQLFVLMWLVAVVLLIACVNVANLCLARAAARQREIAVRRAIGAGRARIIRQLLTESLALSAAGGLLGILFAEWGAHLLVRFLAGNQTSVTLDVSPDLRVLAFTAGISILTGLVFGLTPAIQATGAALIPALKTDQRIAGGAGVFWRKLLTCAQVALSVLLLIGAALFLRSLATLRGLDTGFDRENVLVMSVDPSLAAYDQARTLAYYREAASRVAHIPGVRNATFAYIGLITGSGWGSGIKAEGYTSKEGDPGPDRNAVGPGYFTTLRIPIIRGRDFEPRDNATSRHVAIINESFARFYFGNQNPLGRHIGPGGENSPMDFEIIGVAKDGKYTSLRDRPERFWYIPYEQYRTVRSLTLYARTSGDPLALAGPLQQALHAAGPNVPVFRVTTLAGQIDDDIVLDRLVSILSTFFSVLAALLASVGLYGVMSFAVTRRTREIGIRMALGAQRRWVSALVMREVALVLLTGIVIAIPCALALGKFVASMLYGVQPRDLWSIAGACALMAVAALAAGYLPARRASRVDPIVALRCE